MGMMDRAGHFEDARVIEPNVERLVPVVRELTQLCGEIKPVELALLDQNLKAVLVGQLFSILENPLNCEPLRLGQVLLPVIDDIDLVLREPVPGHVFHHALLLETRPE